VKIFLKLGQQYIIKMVLQQGSTIIVIANITAADGVLIFWLK